MLGLLHAAADGRLRAETADAAGRCAAASRRLLRECNMVLRLELAGAACVQLWAAQQ
jgi:hypothetical protein